MKNPQLGSIILTILGMSLAGCAQLPKNFPKTESHVVSGTSGTALGRSVRSKIAKNGGAGKSGLHVLGGGLDSFVARGALAGRAQRGIDAQYYLLNKDLSGRLFVHQLLKAADRGVRVRLLLDDMTMSGRDFGGAVLDSHPNVEVRIFNPFGRGMSRTIQMVTRLGSVTRRMHNKTFTVDGQISILGGRNIGDEYFGANDDVNFGDLDTLVIGPSVRDISTSFDSYWNDSLAYPMAALFGEALEKGELEQKKEELEITISTPEADRYRDALSGSELARQIRAGTLSFEWGRSHVIADQPEKLSNPRSATELHLTTLLKPYFESTKRELDVISPYFVPTKKGTEFFVGLARSGVRVRILTNSLASTDVAAVHAGYARYRKDLLRAGIDLYEIDPQTENIGARDVAWLGGASKASLHAKSFVFDRQKVFIGSFNFDPRSAKENTEIGIIVESPKLGEQIALEFEEKILGAAYRLELVKPRSWYGGKLLWHRTKNGVTQTYSKDPQTTGMKRLGVGLIGLLPIESQL